MSLFNITSGPRRYVCAVILLLSLATFGTAEERNTDVDEIQAVFIYNFTRFVTWPGQDSLPADSTAPFTIAVAGSSGVRKYLEEIAEKKTVHGRPISVVLITRPDSIGSCQVVFVPPDVPEAARRTILASLEEKPVLTIGAAEDFAARGGGINFVVRDNRVKFEINNGSLVEAGLKASSQLLKLGILVDDIREEIRK